MRTQNVRLAAIIGFIGFLLLIPFTAMKLGVGFNWSAFDFALVAGLLLVTGVTIEIVLRLVTSLKYRLLIGAAILFAAAIVWIELAVGLFGSRFAGS